MANEIQLIDKAALLTKAQEFGFFNGETHYFHYVSVSDIEAAPTIEAEPVVHGRWIRKGNKNECDRCGFFYYDTRADYRRCPMCEAKMDLKEGNHGR